MEFSGNSARENLLDVRNWVQELAQANSSHLHVLDVGAGMGAYYDALQHVQGIQRFDAVEVWEPSIITYNLPEKYDMVYANDVRKMSPLLWAEWDLVIFGDVLEHLSVEEAIEVFNRAYNGSQYVLVSVPNSPYPQGALEGNHAEEHLILDPLRELMPHLPEPMEVWHYPVTDTLIYSKAFNEE